MGGTFLDKIRDDGSAPRGRGPGKLRSTFSHVALQRRKELARERAVQALEDAVALMVHTIYDPDAPLALRLEASKDIQNRYGQPPLMRTENIDAVISEGFKLYEDRVWTPPATFNPTPPPTSGAEEVEVEPPVCETNGHANGAIVGMTFFAPPPPEQAA